MAKLSITLALFCILITSKTYAQTGQKFIAEEYELTGPAGWEMKSDPNSWMPVKFISPLEFPADKFRESINLTLTNKDERWDSLVKEFSVQLKDFTVIKDSSVMINDQKVNFIEYKYRYNEFFFKGKMYFFSFPDFNGILIGYSANFSSYTKFLPDFEATVKSIIFRL